MLTKLKTFPAANAALIQFLITYNFKMPGFLYGAYAIAEKPSSKAIASTLKPGFSQSEGSKLPFTILILEKAAIIVIYTELFPLDLNRTNSACSACAFFQIALVLLSGPNALGGISIFI